jgi:hypothetical protein
MSTSPLDFPEDDQDFEFEEQPQKSSGLLLNIFSGCLVAGMLIIVLLFAVIFINPQSGLNPLPPTTLPALVLTSTPTPTPKGVLPPTWTPTASPSPTTKPTDTPTATLLPPTETPGPDNLPTASVDSSASFAPAEGFPVYSANDYKPEDACSWFGVIGQVIDQNGDPVSSLVVEAGGSLGEQQIELLTLSGMAQNVGEGGFELYFGDQPLDTEGSVYIQLLDQSDLPLSEEFYFDTYSSCDQNLIRINFLQEPDEE